MRQKITSRADARIYLSLHHRHQGPGRFIVTHCFALRYFSMLGNVAVWIGTRPTLPRPFRGCGLRSWLTSLSSILKSAFSAARPRETFRFFSFPRNRQITVLTLICMILKRSSPTWQVSRSTTGHVRSLKCRCARRYPRDIECLPRREFLELALAHLNSRLALS